MPASAHAAETASALKKGTVVPTFNCSVGGTCNTQGVLDTCRCTFLGLTNTENIIKGTELIMQVAEPKRKDGTDEPASKRQKCDASAQAASGHVGVSTQEVPLIPHTSGYSHKK